MGRRRTIEPDQVLDAAEKIVRGTGVAGLTIDAVAKAVGITKGGVQSCFGTKDALIDAMLTRWANEFETDIGKLAGPQPTPQAVIRAHIAVTERTDEAESDRAAGLMAALLDTKEHLQRTQEWYGSRLQGLDFSSEEARRLRLAFLANEGAFLLRCFGFLKMSEQEWSDAFVDIKALMKQ